jgi:UPF0716 protein FxsA
MLVRLLLLFTLVPLIELALLIKLGEFTGAPATIALVIFTGALGAILARREGLKTWQTIQHKIGEGQSPEDELVDGLLILLAGVVLITPGLITDLAGFALLVPPIRRWFRRRLSRYLQQRIVVMHQGPVTRTPDYDIIDSPPDE